MEKVFFVINRDLTEVNNALKSGGTVKMIKTVAEAIGSYGYANRDWNADEKGVYRGDIFAYVVVEV